MSKELPFFKFFPSDWMMGQISTKNYHYQGVFIKLCCLYWQNDCSLKLDKIKGWIPEKEIKVLESYGIIKIQKSKIVIKFLNEQSKVLAEKHAVLSAAGRKGGQATLKPPLSEAKATPKHKEEDKDKKKIKIKKKIIEEEKDKDIIPEISEFLDYAKESCMKAGKDFMGLKFSIEAKYESWKENEWKDGNDKKIKSWKTKFNNTLPYLKENARGGRRDPHDLKEQDYTIKTF